MTDLRPVLFVTGLVLAVLALAMGLPALVDAVDGNPDWLVFTASAGVTLFLGLALAAANLAGRRRDFSIRQTFLLPVAGLLAASLAGSFPFAFSHLHLSATDAWFEAVSGVTTTGSTVLHGLPHMPPGILMWRALLQWLGGAGFLLVSFTVLPDLGVGGMQMFRLESSGAVGSDRVMSRGARTVLLVLLTYGLLSVLFTLLLWLAGMTPFDALLHAMGTVSTGGFSSSDGSIGSWHRPGVDWVILLGMLMSGAPFILYPQIAQRRWAQVRGNSQLRWYLSLIVLSALAIAAWLLFTHNAKPLPALRHGLFAATSVLTSTGYATLDWGGWGGLPLVILFFLMFVGGCAGSPAGGLKIFRLQILFASARMQLARLVRPHAVLLPAYERCQISGAVRESVLGHLFLYCLSFAILAMLLGMVGMDFLTALTAAAAALGNLGAGLTERVGPMTGYAHLPDNAKWLLSAAMLYGRLELYLLLVVVSPDFWKN
ncbi:Trk system potassium uptake protein TrkH [mine drainage metagenome]|uniref:Trk system potassium uptake protein TrkH n=1 Tax=mine drainage metagenome TaxID=410659 RepID=A0A1J5RFT3_9ZZZZ